MFGGSGGGTVFWADPAPNFRPNLDGNGEVAAIGLVGYPGGGGRGGGDRDRGLSQSIAVGLAFVPVAMSRRAPPPPPSGRGRPARAGAPLLHLARPPQPHANPVPYRKRPRNSAALCFVPFYRFLPTRILFSSFFSFSFASSSFRAGLFRLEPNPVPSRLLLLMPERNDFGLYECATCVRQEAGNEIGSTSLNILPWSVERRSRPADE